MALIKQIKLYVGFMGEAAKIPNVPGQLKRPKRLPKSSTYHFEHSLNHLQTIFSKSKDNKKMRKKSKKAASTP